jgi:7,8-dihydropterin-6-yl-methyl-4-(beta-D-ribofuranosyl)aminobenzene 5'-phosphate synthase
MLAASPGGVRHPADGGCCGLRGLQAGKRGRRRVAAARGAFFPEALITNIELMGADPRKINTLILSHGHNDHWGGLMGFLEKERDLLPADLTLYCGGEDNFCHRYAGTMPGPFTEKGLYG